MEGIITMIGDVTTNKSNWSKAPVTISNNGEEKTFNTTIGPDNMGLLKVGTKVGITTKDGKFGVQNFLVTPRSEGSSGGGNKKSYNNSSGGGTRDNYWANKEKYEQEVRDPQIRLQVFYDVCLKAADIALSNGKPLSSSTQGNSASEIITWAREVANKLADGGCKTNSVVEQPQVTQSVPPAQTVEVPVGSTVVTPQQSNGEAASAFDYNSFG